MTRPHLAPLLAFAITSCGWLGSSSPTAAPETVPAEAASPSSPDHSAAVAPAGPPEFECPDAMVYIPGSSEIGIKPYCLDRTEVTVAAYQACAGAGVCSDIPLTGAKDENGDGENDFLNDPGDPLGGQVKFWRQWCNGAQADGRQDHPINCVFWSDAVTYCEHAGRRLPPETHWMWAANGAKGKPFSKFSWGDRNPGHDEACWSGGGKMRRTTCAVGTIPNDSTAQGVLDMTGNVPEWTATGLDMIGNPSEPGVAKAVHGGGWTAMDLGYMHIGQRKRGPGPVTLTAKGGEVTGAAKRRLDLRDPAINEDGRFSGIGFRCMWTPEMAG